MNNMSLGLHTPIAAVMAKKIEDVVLVAPLHTFPLQWHIVPTAVPSSKFWPLTHSSVSKYPQSRIKILFPSLA